MKSLKKPLPKLFWATSLVAGLPSECCPQGNVSPQLGARCLVRRAFILGNNFGYYVQALLQHVPAGFQAEVIGFSDLQSTLATDGETFSIRTESGFKSLTSEDVILVRSMGRGSLESIVFRMDCLSAVEQMGCKILNPPKSLEWAIDKYASLSQLVRAGLPILSTHVSQTTDQALIGFQNLGGDVVIKPIFGGEGRGLMRVADEDHAERVFRSMETLDSVIYQQRFLPNARDIRVLIVGDRHWAVQRVGSDWRKNTSRGAKPALVDLRPQWLDLAMRGTSTLGLSIAGVDLLVDSDNQPYILEINGVPGWRGIEAIHSVCIASEIWKLVGHRS